MKIKHAILYLLAVFSLVTSCAAFAAQWSLSQIQTMAKSAQAEAQQTNITPTQAYQRMNAEAHEIDRIVQALSQTPVMLSETQQMLLGEEGETGPGPVIQIGNRKNPRSYQCANPAWVAQVSPNVTSTFALGGNVMALAYALQSEVEAWQADSASAFALLKTHSVNNLIVVIQRITQANKIVGSEMDNVAGIISNPTHIETLPLKQAGMGMGPVYAPSTEHLQVATYPYEFELTRCPKGVMSASYYGLYPMASAAAQNAMQLSSSQTQGLLNQFSQGPSWALAPPLPNCMVDHYPCDPSTKYFGARRALLIGLAYNIAQIRGRLQQILPGIEASNTAIQQATTSFDQTLSQAGFNTP